LAATLFQNSGNVGKYLWRIVACLAQALALQTGNASPSRTTIAIIQIENVPHNGEDMRWEVLLGDLLRYRMSCVDSIRVLPGSSMLLGYHVIGFDPRKEPSGDQVRNLGRAIESKYVIWGNYHKDQEDWTLTLRLMEVSSGNVSGPFTTSATNWVEITSRAVSAILQAMQITPTQREIDRMSRVFNTSTKALDLLSKALLESAEHGPTLGAIDSLRQSVEADPSFAFSRQMLAAFMTSTGDLENARKEAKLAVKTDPDLAPAHFTLANVYLADGLNHLAEQELKEAVRIDPDWPDPYIKLSDVLASVGNWSNVNSVLTNVSVLAPFDPQIHLRRGFAYVNVNEHDAARQELQSAERFSEKDRAIEYQLGQAYRLLNDIPTAISHFETYIALAKRDGAQSSDVQKTEAFVVDMQRRLVPALLRVDSPEWLPLDVFTNALRKDLTSGECGLVSIPFAATERMASFAKQTVLGASDDLTKAKRLFDAIACRISFGRDFLGLTAAEAYEDWSKEQPEITCQDYTLLYMALARTVGLKAFYVMVNRDYTSNVVFHTCVGLPIDGKALLIDPMYHWFGVPHKEYEFESDFRVMAAFLAQSKEPAKQRIGLKLAHGWSLPYFEVAKAQAEQDDMVSAKQTLQAGLAFDNKSWLSFSYRADIDVAESDWTAAARDLRVCLEFRPDFADARFQLGRVLYQMKDLHEARVQFREYLRTARPGEHGSLALQAISDINAILKDNETGGN
jgi:tetratricopeptide (TPR) repeat protein